MLKRRLIAAAAFLPVSLTLACGVPLPAPQLTATAEHSPLTTIGSGLTGQPAPTSALVMGPTATIAAEPPAAATPSPEAAAASPTPPVAAAVAPLTREVEAGVSAAAPPPTATPGPPAVAPTALPIGDLTGQALSILNDYRKRSGISALQVNARLSAAANSYAKLMADSHWFGHQGPDGSSPQGRIAAAGYKGQFKGEALAGGQSTAQQVINTWLQSPAHAAILLEPTSVEVGIGYYFNAADTYGHYWSLVTGTP